ncbi:activator-dependent family glycosyltransferase [Amycolatopsis lurida]
MRVLLCTLPQKTHFLGMVPLAWALRTAGHEVRVASQPKFTETITGAGLTAVPVGTDVVHDAESDNAEARESIRRGLPKPYDVAELLPAEIPWTDEIRESHQLMVTYAIAAENAPMVTELVEFSRFWKPDLVLWEPFTYAGPIAARASGAVHARMLFTLDILGVAHEWVQRQTAQDPLVGWLTETARTHRFDYSADLLSGQFTIDQLCDSLRVAADLRYLSVRYVPYGGAAVVPGWLAVPPRRPRVALTMGLSTTEYFNGYTVNVRDVLDELSDLDIELIATITEPEQEKLGRVPGNARLVPYVPLHALAPTCAAAIHHGGFGTLSTFALHAVPQLALPYHFEGPLLARKLAGQGAGLSLHSDFADGRAIRAKLLRLLEEPGFADRARLLRKEIFGLPTPNQFVHQLEEITVELR